MAKAPTLPKPSGEDYTGHAMASLLAELNGVTGPAN